MFQTLKRLTEAIDKLSELVDDNLDDTVQKCRKIKETFYENK